MMSLVASLLLTVLPQASVSGPSVVMPGPLVMYDASASVSDSPIEWFVITGCTPYAFKPQPNSTALFSSELPGLYNVVVVARGQKDATSPVVSSVAFVPVTVGAPAPPTPPAPPLPTDPMALAALKYHAALDATYAAVYGTAAASAGSATPPTLASIYATLGSQAASGAAAANASAFGAWQSQLPPSGTEPTSPAQWALLKSYFSAISQAFGSNGR